MGIRRIPATDVISIYKLSSNYSMSLAQIAKKFNCSIQAVIAIRDKRIRKDVIEMYIALSSTACPKQKIEQVLEETKAQIEQRQEKIKQVLPILKQSIKANKEALKDYERDKRKSAK